MDTQKNVWGNKIKHTAFNDNSHQTGATIYLSKQDNSRTTRYIEINFRKKIMLKDSFMTCIHIVFYNSLFKSITVLEIIKSIGQLLKHCGKRM